MSRRTAEIEFWLWAGLAIAAYMAVQWGSVLGCLGQCYVDTESLHGPAVGSLEGIDTRLNTWILAWTQNALLDPGRHFFDGAILYPAPGALAGSEHLIGPALLSLPVRIFSDNAVLNYGIALITSGLILGLSTAALTRWATGSRTIAIAADVVALAMPWRIAEVGHLQLLSAGFIPLVLYLFLKLMRNEAGLGALLGLFFALTLQLLSSYYLAYQMTLCLMVVGLVGLFWIRPDGRSWARIGFTLVISYVLLAAVSIPYLSRAAQGEMRVTFDPEQVLQGNHLGNAIHMLWPRFDTLWQRNPGFEPAFFVPAMVLALALLSLIWVFIKPHRSPSDDAPNVSRAKLVTVSLWLCSISALFMLPGPHVVLGEEIYRLPAYWAAQLVPGFVHLRAPHRWAILIATAMPVLAALGASSLVRLCGQRVVRNRVPLSAFVLALLAGLLVINLPLERLPVHPAQEGSALHTNLYRALEQLPPGPLLEIPWPLDSLERNTRDTRYMLSATQHPHPLLNGFTAHPPQSFFLLNRISQNLPATRAIDHLSQLTDLRWIVVHWDSLSPAEKEAWRTADRGDLNPVYSDQDGAIFELVPLPQTGQWMPALLDAQPRERTLTGLPRSPVQSAGPLGRILSLGATGPFRFLGEHPIPQRVQVEILNATSDTWPGLDIQDQGLLAFRYSVIDLQGQLVAQDLAPLDADIFSGISRLTPVIRGPTRNGSFWLCLELVQLGPGGPVELPMAPAEIEIVARGIEADRDASIGRWRRYRELQRETQGDSASRCVREHQSPE